MFIDIVLGVVLGIALALREFWKGTDKEILGTAAGGVASHLKRSVVAAILCRISLIGAIAGHFASFVQHDFERALRLFDKALEVNPNSAFTWAWSAVTYCYLGEPEEALQRLEHYRQLGPLSCYAFLGDNVYAITYTIAGRYAEAVAWGRKVVHDYPNFSNGYKPLLASLGHAGRVEEAQAYLQCLLRLEPDFSISIFQKHYPFHQAADREHYIAGLRKAGVPKVAGSTPEKVIHLSQNRRR